MMISQVTFETVGTVTATVGTPMPLSMLMHGSEGVTPPVQFDITVGPGAAVYDRTTQAVGDLSQLTIWMQPSGVCS